MGLNLKLFADDFEKKEEPKVEQSQDTFVEDMLQMAENSKKPTVDELDENAVEDFINNMSNIEQNNQQDTKEDLVEEIHQVEDSTIEDDLVNEEYNEDDEKSMVQPKKDIDIMDINSFF